MMAQPFPAGMAPGHPGMGGHGHPMAGMQHPAGAHMGGPPGPGMMQGMHPGVSGPQVSQGPMVTGMPVGPGTPAPGPMHNGSMAMAHLGPQQHMFQQQNPQMAFGNMQMTQQQAMMRQQMMRQMQQQQQQQNQQGGMPVTMPGHPNFNQAQLAQMKMAGMPLQPQQMQAFQHAQGQQMANQQRIMQAHAHQQAMNLAAQNQQRQQQAQQMQLTRSQEQQTSQPPQPHPTPAPQNQGPPQSQPTPQAPNQQPHPKPQPQQQPATTQAPSAPTPQVKQNENEDSPQIKQQDMAAAVMMQDMQKESMPAGLYILQLVMFQDNLATPESPNDLHFWEGLIAKYFASYGSLKQQFLKPKTGHDKSYQLQFPSLARFFHAHFGSGIKQILLQSHQHIQSRTASGGMYVNSDNASLTYVFHNDIRVTTSGKLSVLFDESTKIVRFDLSTERWQEYLPKTLLLQAQSPDQKQSPKMNKNLKKVQQQAKASNLDLNIPSSGIGDFGVPTRLLAFLEVAEVITQMQPLMEYYQSHSNLAPRDALHQLNTEHQQNFATINHAARLQNQMARNANGQIQFPSNMNPNMNGPNQFASPAMGHLGLPQGQGSPHIGGPVHTPSPAHNQGQGGVAMMHQMSAQGSNLSGSQGPSTNTSPNVSNKRRRPSAIKLEEENASQEGNAKAVKPSPRMGGKRQKAG